MGWSSTLPQSDPYIVSRQASVAIQPLYQNWSAKDGNSSSSFSEFGTTVSLYLPVGRNISLSLRGGQFNAGGDVTKVGGISDFQLGAGYHWEAMNAIVSCGINLPTGKRDLSPEEFQTSILCSSSLFNFQFPYFGQGFGLNPGIAWVFPISDAAVLGFGATYQYKGKYTPTQGIEDYKPGDEFLLTGGVDARMSELNTLSGDLTFIGYGVDKIGGEKVYASGNALSINVQDRQFLKENELWVFLRYRIQAKGEIGSAGGLTPEPERIEPGKFESVVQYRMNLSPRLTLRVFGEVRVFEKTPSPFSDATIFGIGALPTFTLQNGIFFPIRATVHFGSQGGGTRYTGIELGAGVGFAF
jgi:hypothetical protein